MKAGKALIVNSITADTDAYGMYAGANSEILVEGDLEIKLVKTTGEHSVGLAVEGDNGEIHVKGNLKIPGYIESDDEGSGIMNDLNREGIVNKGKNGKLMIDGSANIVFNGGSSSESNTVIFASGENSHIRIGGGYIRAEGDDSCNYRLIDGQNGTILINMNEDGTLAGDKETVLYGTIFTNQPVSYTHLTLPTTPYV